VLERCRATEGWERAWEAVPLATLTPFAALSVLAEKVNSKRVPSDILHWDEFGGSILRTLVERSPENSALKSEEFSNKT
jgi:hypothetical protein